MGRMRLIMVVLAAGVVVACEPRPAEETAEPEMTAGEAATEVQATLTEWSVALSQGTIPAGKVRFTVSNQGTVGHALEVEGGGEEWETETIGAGGSATLDAELAPGTYEVYCPVEDERGNHEQLGMRTTLTVQ